MKSSTRILGILSAACATLLAGSVARAEEREFSYSLTLTGASDYMFRGISDTGSDPTVNSYVELDYDIAYLAFWTSNIDTGTDGSGPWEQDIYAGIRPTTGPIEWDLAVWWYIYGNKADGPGGGVWDTDYVEFKVAASTSPITNLTLGVTGYYAPDQGFATPTQETIEGSVSYELPQMGIFTPTISGALGYWWVGTNSDNPAYFSEDSDGLIRVPAVTYWNAGVKLDVEKFFMDFRYWDTDLNTADSDARFVFSAGVNLVP
jgi:uncharacterized protein (TIGR02001 family)